MKHCEDHNHILNSKSDHYINNSLGVSPMQEDGSVNSKHESINEMTEMSTITGRIGKFQSYEQCDILFSKATTDSKYEVNADQYTT